MLAILQFDSVALSLCEQMLADGRLPTLAAVREAGRWEPIDARATFLQSSTYMSLCTGMDVREHGVYSAVPWSAADQRAKFMYAVPHPPTIWERLTAGGVRSLVVDPILAWAPDAIDGVFLSGWQFEDRMVARGLSLPHGARRSFAHQFGRPPRLDDVYGRRRTASLFAWRDALVRAPGRVADVAVDLLGRETFDMVWLNFAAAHKAGHHLWDPRAVAGEPMSEADGHRLQAGLGDVYAAVDHAIARVLEVLPAGADVIVFSPTGMGANTSRADLLPGMIDAILSGARPSAGTTGRTRSPIWALRSAVPLEWRDSIARVLLNDLVADLATRLYFRRDWARTRAAAVPGENKGYVRVNLKGREREGIVEPAEVDALLDTIGRGLMTFVDPGGGPSIARVERMSELAGGGACVDRLPDLVVHWGDSPPAHLSRVTSPAFGTVHRAGVGSGRSGNHVDDAWAILLPGDSRVRELGRPATIADIGATACALFDANLSGLTGTSLL